MNGIRALLRSLAASHDDPAAAEAWLANLDEPAEQSWLRSWISTEELATSALAQESTWKRLARVLGRTPLPAFTAWVDDAHGFDAWASGARRRWEITPDWHARAVIPESALAKWRSMNHGSSTELWVTRFVRPAPPEFMGHESSAPGPAASALDVPSPDPSALLRQARQAIARADPSDPASTDRARSLAERVLFESLQAHPKSHGRFRLNEGVGLKWQTGRPLEIDLQDSNERIAIEVDGHWHFQDLEAWRRDRQKDLILQQAGWWVLRFLATDVVEAPDQAVSTIINALKERHAIE